MVIAYAKTKGKVETLEFHSHSYYEVYVFHGGDCQYIIDDKVINLTPGTILLMNGRSIHKARVLDNESEYVRSVVHFMPETIEESIAFFDCTDILSCFQEGNVGIRHVTKKENLEKITYAIEELNELSEMKDSNGVNKEIQLGIIQLLMMIDRVSESTFSSNDLKSNIKQYYTEKIIECMQQDFSKPITIESMSNKLNLSSSYMSRIFKEITGYTIMEYLMYYRFTQAKYMIEIASDEKFKDIAVACGFQNSSHFCRFIKDNTGMTPTVFKKSIQARSNISPKK